MSRLSEFMLGHLEQTNELCYNYDVAETAEKVKALNQLSSKIVSIKLQQCKEG